MKKIYKKEGLNNIVNRVEKLKGDERPLWGAMTIKQMLDHGIVTNTAIYNSGASGKKRTLKQLAFKTLVMKITHHIPKGIKGNARFFHPEDDIKESFEEMKTHYKNAISMFIQQEKPLLGDHPIFGRLSTNEWKYFVWLHMDHHLRQFGA